MADLRLEDLSAKTASAANALGLKPGQELFVAPVTYAMASPFLSPATSWSQVVLEGDEVVGFLMANFDRDAPEMEFRSCIWRMNVAAEAQGHGVGRFIVTTAADEARRRGFDTLTVIWEPGDDGPEEFFLRVGFVVADQTQYGESIGVLHL